jgi:hypothetical protein
MHSVAERQETHTGPGLLKPKRERVRNSKKENCKD